MTRNMAVVTILYLPYQGMTMRVNGTTVARAPDHAAVDSILVARAEQESVSTKFLADHPC
jgi:hypothetical protein